MPDERDFEMMDSFCFLVERLNVPETVSKVDRYFENLEIRRLIGSCSLNDMGLDTALESSTPLPRPKGNFQSPLGH